MKKIFYLLSVILTVILFENSVSAYTFTLTGTVISAQTGLPVPNHLVTVYSDSLNGNMTLVQAYTGNNGTYAVTLTVPNGSVMNLNVVTSSNCVPLQTYSQFVTTVNSNGSFTAIVNFSICTSGGGTTTNCQADYSYYIDYNTPNLSSLIGYFTDISSSTDPIVSWNWTTSTGLNSTLQNPSFSFPSLTNGPFTVCLTILTSTGCTSSFCDSIYLYSNPNCSAEFSFTPVSNTTNLYDIHFVPNYISSAIIYSWSFGDGTGSTLSEVDHTYNAPGMYTACLTITNSTGCTDTQCATVVVGDSINTGNCLASFTYGISPNMNCLIGDGYDFYGYNLGGGNVTSWHWEFSDGGFANTQTANHCYADPGVYVVCLTITTSDNCTSTICDSVVVGQTPDCEAGFIYEVQPINENGQYLVVFNDNSFGEPISWQWMFGNGTASTQQNPQMYFSQGTYTICLTITSATGCSDSYCQTIIVGQNTITCEAAFQYYLDTLVNCINCYQFINTSYSASGNYSSYWSFGDGSNSTENSPMHTFSENGVYEVCLTIIAPDSCTDIVCHEVAVGEVANYVVWGFVYAGENPAQNCAVLLMGINGTMLTTVTGELGGYEFNEVPEGTYILYAIPSFALYPEFAPTYYPQALYWSAAQQFVVNVNQENMIINLVSCNATSSGNGIIGGGITYLTIIEKNLLEVSVSNISVLLFDESDNLLEYCLSDESGNFTFDNLPFGTYKVYVELTNYTSTPAIVTLDENHTSITNIPFYISGTEIYPGTIGIQNNTNEPSITVYPNPVKDEVNILVSEMASENLKVEILNSLGQLQFSKNYDLLSNNQKITIPVNNLSSGIYVAKVSYENQSMLIRFIK